MSLVIDGIDYEDLHARIHAAIGDGSGVPGWAWPARAADRRRIDRDLAGLRQHHWHGECDAHFYGMAELCPDAARYAEDMRDVADLYGVEATP